MDFDAKYMENYPSHQIPIFLHDQFSLESTFSSKNTSNFLQDFQPLENFNLNGDPTSLNDPIFALQPTCFYPFDSSSTSSCIPIFDVYETKPFVNHVGNNGTFVPFVDNLGQNGGIGGLLGHAHMMVTPINMVSPSGHSHHPFSYRDFGLTRSCKAPDEGSSSSPKIDLNMASPSFSTSMVKKGGRGRKKKPNVVKGQWTIEEDRLLIELVERYGVRKWSQIAQMLNGRIGKQCRERWHNHLRPDIKKEIWSEEEDRILIKAHEEIGNKWAEIAKKLPGRTENSIKNHWNATKRRQLSRRKCRSKYPRQSSLLQDYIKTLAPETINAGCRKKPPTFNINPNPNPNPNNNNNKVSNDPLLLLGCSNSSSSYRLVGQEYDFGDEVPDFNFDDQMFEESSIDSLLDCVPNNDENVGIATACYVDDDDQEEEDDDEEEYEGKKELDLVEMINQVNL